MVAIAETLGKAQTSRFTPWLAPLVGVVVYPWLVSSGEWAINGYRATGSYVLAMYVLATVLLAIAIPALALRGLLLMRQDETRVQAKGILYLIFAMPSLFTLAFSLARLADAVTYLSAIWAAVWTAIGVTLYFRERLSAPALREANIGALRVVHGVTALCLLVGFLIAHLVNHDLAVWSLELQRVVMDWLRLWYRSIWVEPVLLGMVAILICTGVPMVAHYTRRRMDAFRVVQTATGAYIAVFLCSHLLAILTARQMGVDTNWAFASGPKSLLGGIAQLNRLIPHYFFATLLLIVHVACGLRIVLLKHGSAQIVGNRALYALVGVALVATALSMAALLGFHVM
jgi:hypothetical protein